jgi:hypothetical protein
MKIDGIGLLSAGNYEIIYTNMRGQSGTVKYNLCNIFRCEWFETFIDFFCSFFIAFESHFGKFCFGSAGMNGGDLYIMTE